MIIQPLKSYQPLLLFQLVSLLSLPSSLLSLGTTGLSFLVARPVTATSGKAEKARELGIPIVSESQMWQMLGR